MSLNKIKINDTTTVNTGVVYDISKATSQSYDSLSGALGTDGKNVPPEVREGGMSVRYVQTSDNKYVQYRLMATDWSINVANWQGVDDGIHADSQSLSKSGDVYDFEKVVPLTSISSTVADSGVTKVGDIYFNAYTKKLRRCTVYNTSPTDSIYADKLKCNGYPRSPCLVRYIQL